MKRRAVITGCGAVTPLGVGARTLHERWAAGESGIADGAGACRDFDPKEHLSVKQARRLDRFSQFALVASAEAIEQAGWGDELPYDPFRIGCVIATGIGGIETVEIQHDVMRDKGAKMVSPLGVPQYMPNAGAAAVAMKHGLQGQMFGVVSACSGGAHAIGSALRMIQYGDADAVLAGGAEATLTEFGFACFHSMQALSPTGISRPFDARRDGFTGRLAIHPAQVPVINEVFTPSPEQIEKAKAVVAAFAAQPGAGTIGIDGKMFDRPHLIRAQRLLATIAPSS